MIVCGETVIALPTPVMDNEPWQRRLKDLGIGQKRLARCLRMTETNLSMALRGSGARGVPGYAAGIVVALELMTEDQRSAWLTEMEHQALTARREKAKPKA